MDICVKKEGVALFQDKEYPCALGGGGVVAGDVKKEGDSATPSGCYALRMLLYRPDIFDKPPKTVLPKRALTRMDGWSDDVARPEYNSHVKLPYQGSHEELWRHDEVYNLIIPIGYNDNPPVAGKGSAIFIHIARPEYTPTAGCIAFAQDDLLEILENIDAETKICIQM